MMKHALPLSTLAVWFVATSVLLAQTAPTKKSSDLAAQRPRLRQSVTRPRTVGSPA